MHKEQKRNIYCKSCDSDYILLNNRNMIHGKINLTVLASQSG